MRLSVILLSSILIANSAPQDSSKEDFRTNNFNLTSHESLNRFRQDNKVQGLAFAVFDKNKTVFSECLGNSTRGFKINANTIFSIQSISKNFTAFAVMKAVMDGLLNLDTAISCYIPDFMVNSCFEESPEQKITLRMLLSHTAGFTHEAPVGNNYDYTPCNSGDHINSIKNTWLKSPAGTNYSYSSLGFDLASAIIAKKSGLSFSGYLRENIFQPLSMSNSTTDDNEAVMNLNRTEGNIPFVKKNHYSIPLQGSGAVYTSLNDLIKYTQMLMNYGEASGTKLVDKNSIYELCKININNYGLGTYIDQSDGILYINHNGGGFGYSATLLWFPEYEIGSIVLCNKSCNTFDICFSVLSGYVKAKGLTKDPGITDLFDNLNSYYFKNKTETDRQKEFTCKCDSVIKPEWQKYVGKYTFTLEGVQLKWYARIGRFLGFGYRQLIIVQNGKSLQMTGDLGNSPLKEFEPGLFLSKDNEVLDLRTERTTFRNISIQKK